MPVIAKGMKQLSTQIPQAAYDGLAGLMKRTKRTLAAEVAHAIERHLATPPEVVAPPVVPAKITEGEGAKKLGRPSKRKEATS